jgi:hypothetical protein
LHLSKLSTKKHNKEAAKKGIINFISAEKSRDAEVAEKNCGDLVFSDF